MIFRYNLLCDGCNWEFKGFAVPGTVSTKSSRKRKQKSPISKTDDDDSTDDFQSEAVKIRF
jgi:hypothetical protein